VLYVDEPLLVKHGGHADQLSRSTWGLDRFRIQALEKALIDPVLDERQRGAVRRELERKLGIFVGGARKRRGHGAEVTAYEERYEQLSSEGRAK
jgi:hypothetical protein